MSFTPPEDVNTPYNRFQARGRREEDQGQGDKGGEVFRLESVGTLGSTEVGFLCLKSSDSAAYAGCYYLTDGLSERSRCARSIRMRAALQEFVQVLAYQSDE